MRKLIVLFAAVAALTSSCSKKVKSTGCPTDQICTMIFTSVNMHFVDKAGREVQVKNFKVFNMRTGKYIESAGVVDPASAPTSYTIVTDANRKELSTSGDHIKVTATYNNGNTKILAMFKISGGCNCHVEKIFGPERIVVN